VTNENAQALDPTAVAPAAILANAGAGTTPVAPPGAAPTPVAPPVALPPAPPAPAQQAQRPSPLEIPQAPRDTTIRVVLVEELAQIDREVRRLLDPVPDVRVVETVTDPSNTLERVEEIRPDVIMVDALIQGDTNGLGLVSSLRSAGIATPIIVLTIPERPVEADEAKGISGVLTMPLGDEQVSTLVKRLHAAGPASADHGHLACLVYSAKGGVGKTMVAHNLALTLSRTPGTSVALVDGDLQFGDIRGRIGAPDEARTMYELPVGRINSIDLAGVMWRDPSGIDVLLPPYEVEQAEMVTPQDFSQTLDLLHAAYDVVVVDTASVLNDITLAGLDSVDIAIGVITPDQSVVRNTRRLHEAFADAGYRREQFSVVMNRAVPHGVDIAAIEGELGFGPAAFLPELGTPLGPVSGPTPPVVLAQPESPASQAFFQLAQMAQAHDRRSVPVAA